MKATTPEEIEQRDQLRAANKARAMMERRRPGQENGKAPSTRATTRSHQPGAIGPHQRSLIALGMTPEEARAQVRNQPKGDRLRMKGKQSATHKRYNGEGDGGLAVRIRSHLAHDRRHQAEHDAGSGKSPPPLKDWPSKTECCWPTSDGAPWTFCRQPIEPGSRAGYCATHERQNKPRNAGGTGTMDAADLGTRAPSVTPPMHKNGHHGANRSYNGRVRSLRKKAE